MSGGRKAEVTGLTVESVSFTPHAREDSARPYSCASPETRLARRSARSEEAERQPSKLRVVGSHPIANSDDGPTGICAGGAFASGLRIRPPHARPLRPKGSTLNPDGSGHDIEESRGASCVPAERGGVSLRAGLTRWPGFTEEKAESHLIWISVDGSPAEPLVDSVGVG